MATSIIKTDEIRRLNDQVLMSDGALTSNVVFPALGNSAVGTVSESSGTPTGDIIERGSNANGEYVKYADGTMICHQHFGEKTTAGSFSNRYGTTSGNMARTLFTWTYPSSFISNPVVSQIGAGVSIGVGEVTSESNSEVSLIYYTTSAITITCSASAIGRWY